MTKIDVASRIFLVCKKSAQTIKQGQQVLSELLKVDYISDVWVQDFLPGFPEDKKVHKVSDDTSWNSFPLDLAIVLGGDGTLLYAAWRFQGEAPLMVPVKTEESYGFFMTHSIGQLIEHIRDGKLNGFGESIDTRSRLRGVVGDKAYNFLNEVSIRRGASMLPLHFAVYCNGKPLAKFRADGVIISTPSGSTAYSHSAGGCLVDPKLSSILIVPICPMGIKVKSIIVPDTHLVEIETHPFESATVAFDGQYQCTMTESQHFTVTSSSHPIRLLAGEKDNTWTDRVFRNFGSDTARILLQAPKPSNPHMTCPEGTF